MAESRLQSIVQEAIREHIEKDGLPFFKTPEDQEAYFSELTAEASHIVARIEEAAGGPTHILSIKQSREHGREWTLQHPLAERFEQDGPDGLIGCIYTNLCRVAVEDGHILGDDEKLYVYLEGGAFLWHDVDMEVPGAG